MGDARALRVGDVVLVQGTGGVSVAALQLAVAAGATVIATTSSPEKEAFLTSQGARNFINYKQENEWGVTSREALSWWVWLHEGYRDRRRPKYLQAEL